MRMLMHLFQIQPKQNESTVGSANGSFTLKNTLEEGLAKGYTLSKKITGKDLKISTPISNERSYGQQDKFLVYASSKK